MFPQATLTGHFAADLVACVVGIGGWYVFHIWKLTQDREIRYRGRRRYSGRKTGGLGGYPPYLSPVAPAAPALAVQVLDKTIAQSKPRPEQEAGSSLDSILNPSRKYRLPEAE